MTGQPGRSGGARTGAGRPPGTGGTPGAGRPPGATDVTLSPARLLTPGQKWKFAEKAVQYADQMLQVLVDIALNGESETARILAADKVIDRAMGKAPQHNGRTKADLERVPDRVTKEKIAELIELAATSFGVANDKISEENIRDLLKTGRIRVGRPRT